MLTTPSLTALCPTSLYLAAALVSTLASVYCAATLRAIMRRGLYAWGETSGRVTQLERALDTERERLQALRRIILRGERGSRVADVTQPQQPPPGQGFYR